MNVEITHARIKYLDNHEVDIVPINAILDFKKCKPSDRCDFIKEKVYGVEYRDEKNPETIIVKAIISDLAVGEEEVRKLASKRPNFPRFNDSDIPNTSDLEDSENEIDDAQKLKKRTYEPQSKNGKSSTKTREGAHLQRGKTVLQELLAKESNLHFSDSGDSGNENGFAKKMRHLENVNSSLEDTVQEKDEIKRLMAIIQQQNTEKDKNDSSSSQMNHGQEEGKQQQQWNVETVNSRDNEAMLGDENSTNGNARGANSPTIPHPPSPNEKFKCTKSYINKFIIKSINYYKKSFGHGFKRYTALENGELYLEEGKSIEPVAW